MISHIFGFCLFLAVASAGIATSYSVGTLGLGGYGGLGGGVGGGDGGYGGGLSLGGIGIGGNVGYGGGVLVGGLGGGLGGGHEEQIIDYHTPAKYEFKYGVADPKTGDKKQQSEVRVGDVVKGEYSLAEPDGTIRVVKYTADKHNGFNAVVSRIGHAAHPIVVQKAIPIATHGISLGGVRLSGLSLGGLGLGGLGGGHGGY